ncbi:hypothetical protein [Nostoc sp.]|uniref:hypothetical protein n=1 Tax=Nostoc sp. TaxID=1180 RepID=UPI002FF57F06
MKITRPIRKNSEQEWAEISELSDGELVAVVGGAGLVDLESQLEKLNPQTEVGKALLRGLETLVKGAEAKLEEEIKNLAGT